jgi:hypothetical protein
MASLTDFLQSFQRTKKGQEKGGGWSLLRLHLIKEGMNWKGLYSWFMFAG